MSSIKENPRLWAAAEELKKGGVKVGDAVSEALKAMEESELARAVGVRPCPQFADDLLLGLFCRYPGNGGRLFDDHLDDRAHS